MCNKWTPIAAKLTGKQKKKVQAAFNAACTRVYNGELEKLYLDEGLTRAIYEVLYGGVLESWSLADQQDLSKSLAEALSLNTFEFATFKTEKQLQEVALLMVENGEILPKTKFLQKAKVVFNTYIVAYLTTEYDMAITATEQIRNWEEIMADDTVENLKYLTAPDERVRPQHASLEGIVQPKNSSFWDKYYPPNGWNCRCKAGITSDEASADYEQPDIPELFATNVGKTQTIFPKDHPYFNGYSKTDLKTIQTTIKRFRNE